jgi:YVTN family beta-propeller protein
MFESTVNSALARVYVPNSLGNSVSVIDAKTYQVIETYKTGKKPQHVVPSHDLQSLWVLNNDSNTVTKIDPTTGKPVVTLPVLDPYNMYFTPNGRYAIVVDEADHRFDFRDPQTMKLAFYIPVKCKGVNHLDFSYNGDFAVATCEFSGQLLKLNLKNYKINAYLKLGFDRPGFGSMPQDIRLSPDGKTFYVADTSRNGVFLIDADKFTQIGFIPTGIGAHGIYPSRDGRFFYVSNRGCQGVGCHLGYCDPHGPGSVSVIDAANRKVIANWPIPGGGSPDMGNVSADGKELWLSGRYDSEVYVFDTRTGQLIHRIPVGLSPHGLAVWPQPGRYSLGHTGNMR